MARFFRLYLHQRLAEWLFYVLIGLIAERVAASEDRRSIPPLEYLESVLVGGFVAIAMIMIFSGYMIFAALTALAYVLGWCHKIGYIVASVAIAALTSLGWVTVFGSPIELTSDAYLFWTAMIAMTGVAAWWAYTSVSKGDDV